MITIVFLFLHSFAGKVYQYCFIFIFIFNEYVQKKHQQSLNVRASNNHTSIQQIFNFVAPNYSKDWTISEESLWLISAYTIILCMKTVSVRFGRLFGSIFWDSKHQVAFNFVSNWNRKFTFHKNSYAAIIFGCMNVKNVLILSNGIITRHTSQPHKNVIRYGFSFYVKLSYER